MYILLQYVLICNCSVYIDLTVSGLIEQCSMMTYQLELDAICIHQKQPNKDGQNVWLVWKINQNHRRPSNLFLMISSKWTQNTKGVQTPAICPNNNYTYGSHTLIHSHSHTHTGLGNLICPVILV